MPRSRSRSKERYDDRDRRRSRSRSRERRRDRDKYRASRRSRSRSRDRRRARDERVRDEKPRDQKRGGASPGSAMAMSDDEEVMTPEMTLTTKEITAEDLTTAVEDDEKKMMELMGFGTFDSSKGKKVNGNDHYTANIVRKRRYRQYMNRRGGFNRPLDFIA